MHDRNSPYPFDLSDLDTDTWLEEFAAIGHEQGFQSALGPDHTMGFVEAGETLLVSFENAGTARDISEAGLPVGFELAFSGAWSSLAVVSHGDSHFDEPEICATLDRLADDGFFDSFAQVVFYGAGPGGYAAARYSAVSPRARVLALQPNGATTPKLADWGDVVATLQDQIIGGYGYAPAMLDGAEDAFVVYDPRVAHDALHASIFTGANVTKLRMPSLGTTLPRTLNRMGRLHGLLDLLAAGRLNEFTFAQALRARRDDTGYLLRLLTKAEQTGHPELAQAICRYAAPRMQVPRFHRRLRYYQRQSETGAPELS